jgi:uncharacterized protein
MTTVAWLSIAPVKGLGLEARDEIQLERFGVADNRRFYLVDESGRMVNGKVAGALVAIHPRVFDSSLALELPDGTIVEDRIELGAAVTTNFFGRPVRGHLVVGPWSEALSAALDRAVRLVETDEPGAGVDRGSGAVTILSRASLTALSRVLGDDVDERRFRMLIGVDGCREHEEDEWLERDVAIGEAVVRPRGNVGRCAVTTQNPSTGVPDLGTLKGLAAYRAVGTEPLPFGIYGEVVRPGRIRIGDPVIPSGA